MGMGMWMALLRMNHDCLMGVAGYCPRRGALWCLLLREMSDEEAWWDCCWVWELLGGNC